MVDALRKAGCAVDKRFFSVETCDQAVVGGFRPPDGVRTRRSTTHPLRTRAPPCFRHATLR
jgi:inner membrane protease ATP23